jgi:hypothetical protein
MEMASSQSPAVKGGGAEPPSFFPQRKVLIFRRCQECEIQDWFKPYPRPEVEFCLG